MNNNLFFLFLIIWVISNMSIQSQLQMTDKMVVAERKVSQSKISFKESSGYDQTDFIYQRMEWEVDPAVRFISGKITTYFKVNVNRIDSINLDAHPSLVIDSVIGSSGELAFDTAHQALVIHLSEPLNKDDIDSFSVSYHGVPTSTGFGSFEVSVHGTDNTPVMWTLSEPYGAMEWWPCKQSLADKIDSIDIIVTSPEAYRTASNGIVVSEKVAAGKRTMHWKHRFPIATYLVAIAVTDYAAYSDTLKLDDGRVIDILNYVYPEKLTISKTQTPVTAQVMEVYNELIGEYPFASEKYGHAQFGWSGGMEHQTMSFMYNFNFDLIAHELAHQWFGDYITTGSWQDIWLNEGFATYMNALAIERLQPEKWHSWKKSTVTSIVSSTAGSVFVVDTASVNRIFNYRLSYQKGSYVLHMLRWVLGDAAFFSGLRNYFNDPEIANGFATSAQFIKHMEVAGDTSLTEFFNDWLYGEGYPVYTVIYQQDANHQLTIRLSQSTSHSSVSFFEMPVPVRVYNANRSLFADFRLNQTLNTQTFTVDPGFEVAELEIDPNYWLVSKTGSVTGVPTIDEKAISLSPNPVHDVLQLRLNSAIQLRSIEVFSINGSHIKSFANNSLFLNVSDLPNGTFLLRINTSEGSYQTKFIKQ